MRLKKFLYAFMIISILLLALGAIPAAASGETLRVYQELGKGQAEFVLDEIVVKFANDHKPFRVIKVPEGKVREKIAEYSRRPDVVYAEPNYYAQAFSAPNDPLYQYQWNFDNSKFDGIGMEEAWATSPQAGGGVTVAIVDTGIAYENYGIYGQAPDLAGTAFAAGYDFVNNDSHANDDNSHGTHVAGTVAQSTNNGLGVAGIAYGATLMPVKVLDKKGSGSYTNIAQGIIWAADHGAKVINMSLGGPVPSPILKDALHYAYDQGVTIVAAAGNDGAGTVSFPAAYDDYVIAVGATRYDQTLAPYSNYGSSLDLVAPGGDTTVDQNGDGYSDGILQNTFNPTTKQVSSFGYWFFQGTSMASPHVAGVAALLIANDKTMGPDDVRATLEGSAEDLGVDGRDNTYGYGLVSASAALNWSPEANTQPVANYQSVTANEDSPQPILLSGTDSDDDLLTYDIVSGPSHGALSAIVGNTLTYTPAPNYNGGDSFSFRVFDGSLYSEPATVSITVSPVNDPPVAEDQTVAAQMDTAIPITLTAADVDGDLLTYALVTSPGHGVLSGTAPNLTYTPDVGYTGTDSFSFKADDTVGGVSDPAVVSISVAGSQVAPVVNVSIDMSTATKKIKKNTFAWGIAVVTVLDDSNNPVAAATVEGYWTGITTDSDTGSTDASGKVTLLSDQVKMTSPTIPTFTFNIERILIGGVECQLQGDLSASTGP